MAGGQEQDSKAFGQRSISSMFSNSSITSGRSGSRGPPLPLMEFLTRKLEKRSSQNQGCQVNGGLTPEVKNRLETIGKSDTRLQTNNPLAERTCSHDRQGSLACTRDAPWPLQRSAQSMWAEDLQFHGSSKHKLTRVYNLKKKKSFQQSDEAEHPLDEEFKLSGSQNEAPNGKRLDRKWQFAASSDSKLGGRFGGKAEASHSLDTSRGLEKQKSARLDIFNAQPSSRNSPQAHSETTKIVQEHHSTENSAAQDPGRQHMDFIDLTEDEDPLVRRVESEQDAASVREERIDNHKKRKRLKTLDACISMERCPVCNDMVPVQMLQAHVESELDALELLDRNRGDKVQDAPDAVTQCRNDTEEHGVAHAWQDQSNHDRNLGRLVQLKQPSYESRCRSAQSLLVLGDDPKLRRQPNFRPRKERPTAVFNHYADGGGWWDEGAVGVDAEAVGSTSVWEGLGSMSFGSML